MHEQEPENFWNGVDHKAKLEEEFKHKLMPIFCDYYNCSDSNDLQFPNCNSHNGIDCPANDLPFENLFIAVGELYD